MQSYDAVKIQRNFVILQTERVIGLRKVSPMKISKQKKARLFEPIIAHIIIIPKIKSEKCQTPLNTVLILFETCVLN